MTDTTGTTTPPAETAHEAAPGAKAETVTPPAETAPEGAHAAAETVHAPGETVHAATASVHAATAAPAEAIDGDAEAAALDTSDVIKNHVIAAMAVGLVPIPGVDMAAMIGVQVRMVHQISGIYGVTLRDNAARATVLSLIGGVLPAALGTGLVSGLKIIPGFGSLAGAAGSSLLGGALTYAVGNVFHEHLESQGGLIDFNSARARAAMRREFDNGMEFVKTLRGKVTSAIVPNRKAEAAAAAHASTDAEPVAA